MISVSAHLRSEIGRHRTGPLIMDFPGVPAPGRDGRPASTWWTDLNGGHRDGEHRKRKDERGTSVRPSSPMPPMDSVTQIGSPENRASYSGAAAWTFGPALAAAGLAAASAASGQHVPARRTRAGGVRARQGPAVPAGRRHRADRATGGPGVPRPVADGRAGQPQRPRRPGECGDRYREVTVDGNRARRGRGPHRAVGRGRPPALGRPRSDGREPAQPGSRRQDVADQPGGAPGVVLRRPAHRSPRGPGNTAVREGPVRCSGAGGSPS